MSSAILYVAIVAIWIGVLVPRWLHHDGAATGTGLRRLSRHFGGSRPAAEPGPRAGHEPEGRAGFDPEGHPRYTSFVPPEPQPDAPASPSKLQVHHEEHVSSAVSGNRESMAQLYEADASPSPVRSYGWSAEEATRQDNRPKKGATKTPAPAPAAAGSGHHGPHESARHIPPARQAPSAPHVPAARRGESQAPGEAGYEYDSYYGDGTDEAERRARLVRSRRRILELLVVLVIAGVGLTVAKLASWWIMIPPVVLLGGYLLLLREAAHADAETRERREAERHEAALADAQDGPATTAEPAPAPAATAAPAAAHHETGPRAAVIDLSEHVGDQLYDQYADAKLRAVGD